jgi:hypothetical protein
MSLTSQQHAEVEVVQPIQSGDIEDLRQILIMQKHDEVSHDEAKEIGAALIEFFEVLATEIKDELD